MNNFFSTASAFIESATGVAFGVDTSSTKGVQTALFRLGYDPGPIDGKPGKRTAAAVRAYQQAKGLAPDGIVGKQTRASLDRDIASQNSATSSFPDILATTTMPLPANVLPTPASVPLLPTPISSLPAKSTSTSTSAPTISTASGIGEAMPTWQIAALGVVGVGGVALLVRHAMKSKRAR